MWSVRNLHIPRLTHKSELTDYKKLTARYSVPSIHHVYLELSQIRNTAVPLYEAIWNMESIKYLLSPLEGAWKQISAFK